MVVTDLEKKEEALRNMQMVSYNNSLLFQIIHKDNRTARRGRLTRYTDFHKKCKKCRKTAQAAGFPTILQ